MRLRRLEVEHFGCVAAAQVELRPGLNVLFGPNDLGKSTLIAALRAALLLPHGSTAHHEFVSWSRPETHPSVKLVLETEPERVYRVSKTFGSSGSSRLEQSRDGLSYTTQATAREVDGKLRELLGWGLPAPGRNQGLPDSFLVRALLATQPGSTALFSSALSDDKETSGREQVQRALEALAEDPLFKRVLDYASTKVREAFTATGRRQSGKTHFWKTYQAELAEADAELDRLRRQKAESDAVIARLAQLNLELEAAQEAKGRAEIEVATVKRRLALQQQLLEAEQRLKAVSQQHARLAQEEQAQAAAAQALTEAERQLAACVEARTAAETARSATRKHREAAASELQALQGDARVAARALQVQKLEASRDRLRSELTDLQRHLQLLESAQGLQAQAQSSAQKALELTAEAEKAQASVKALVAEQAELQREQSQLEQLGAFLSLRGLSSEQARLAPQLAAFSEDAQARASLEAEIVELSAALNGKQLPTAEAVQELRGLERERDLAQSRLNVGLELRITPETPELKLLLDVDGALSKATLKAPERVAARRELKLELPGVAKLEFTAGSSEHRTQAAALNAAFDAASQPVLRAAQAADLEALEALLAAAQRLEQAQQQRAHLERSAAQQTELEARLAALDAQIKAARKKLGALALERLTKQLEAQLGGPLFTGAEGADAVLGAQLESQTGACDARLKALVEQLRLAEAAARETELQQRIQADRADQERGAAHTAVAAALADLDVAATHATEPEAALSALKITLAAKLSATQAQLREAEQLLELQTSGEDPDQASAAARLAACVAAEERAELTWSQADAAWVSATSALAVAESSLASRREALAAQSAELIREEYTRATQAVDAERRALAELVGCHPDDLSLVSAEQETEALAEVESTTQSLNVKQREIDTLRGSLTQVGGDVVAEALADARAAQTQARRVLEDTEERFDAWKLLETVLHEAEQQGDANLGAALAAPVAARFSELTAGRYASLKLDAHLQTQGVGVEGRFREVSQLSAGTQEQLATLLRLTLAEQLQTTLILDDHLTQTDSLRMQWFREKLYEVAETTQIVVVTCWPEHFVLEGHDAHRVDLEQVIQRA